MKILLFKSYNDISFYWTRCIPLIFLFEGPNLLGDYLGVGAHSPYCPFLRGCTDMSVHYLSSLESQPVRNTELMTIIMRIFHNINYQLVLIIFFFWNVTHVYFLQNKMWKNAVKESKKKVAIYQLLFVVVIYTNYAHKWHSYLPKIVFVHNALSSRTLMFLY